MNNATGWSDMENEILALFEDESILSQIENILLNSEMDTFNLFNIPDSETSPPTTGSCQEIDENDEYRNNEQLQNREHRNNDQYRDREHHNNRPNTTSNQDKDTGIFAKPEVFFCMYCPRRFHNRIALRRHQMKHAKEQLRCPRCRIRSYSYGILRRHYIYFHYIHRKKFLGRISIST